MTGRLEGITESQMAVVAKAARYQPGLMAVNFHVSLRQFERLFTDRFKKNPSDWCRELRARNAVPLIAQGMPIKAVAAELYYANASHFCHEFKKVYGLAPGAFVLAVVAQQRLLAV
jgi:AraC-like DNA-binding protein